MMPIYRPILKIAWQILWRVKYLWFFGFFAVLVSNSGEVNLLINNYSNVKENSNLLAALKSLSTTGFTGSFVGRIREMFSNINLSTAGLILVLLFLFIFVLWLAVVSQASLINGANQEYRRQKFNFLSCLKEGRQKFWPVFWLTVVGKIIISLAMIIVGTPLAWLYIKQNNDTAQFLFILLSFAVLIPLAIIISFVIKYAKIYAVLNKQKVGEALKNAWKLFINNWVVSIEMAVILFLVTILAGLAIVVVAVVLAIPLSLLLYLFYVLQVQGFLMLSTIVIISFLIIILFWIASLLSTYQTTCWVLLFDKLNSSKVYSKISRLLAALTMKKESESESAIE